VRMFVCAYVCVCVCLSVVSIYVSVCLGHVCIYATHVFVFVVCVVNVDFRLCQLTVNWHTCLRCFCIRVFERHMFVFVCLRCEY